LLADTLLALRCCVITMVTLVGGFYLRWWLRSFGDYLLLCSN